MAIHEYFQNNGYVYAHTPLITTTDCEGSDQMFKITTLDMENLPLNDEKKVDYKKDLFGKPAYITGSGQLHGETYAMAYKKIYTFGPTMRTEHSNTKTHANEFWMIEPEVAFCDLDGLMDMALLEGRRELIAGINHMAWLLKLEDKDGRDLYPEIKSRIQANT